MILNNQEGNFGKKSLLASSFEKKLEEAENIEDAKDATIIFSATENSVLAVQQVKAMQKKAMQGVNNQEEALSKPNNLSIISINSQGANMPRGNVKSTEEKEILEKDATPRDVLEKIAITFTYEPLARAYGFLNAILKMILSCRAAWV